MRSPLQPADLALRTPNPSRQQGFTLIELLIALTLVSLMMVMLYGGLHLGSRSWDAVEQRSAMNGDQRLIWGFVQRMLTQMQGLYLPGRAKRHLAFSGEQEAIEFITVMPDRLGIGGAYIIRIEAHKQGNERRLMMRRWLYHAEVLEGLGEIPEWTPLFEQTSASRYRSDAKNKNAGLYSEHLLLEGVEKLEFEYFGRVRGSNESRWHERWDEALILPKLVRMTLETEQGEWPPLVAALPGVVTTGTTGGFPSIRRR